MVLGLFGGLLFALLTPPYQVPDEQTHLFRAYQIAEGGLIAESHKDTAGGTLPHSIGRADHAFWQVRFHPDRKLDPQTVFDLLTEPLQPEKRQFVDFNNTAVFSPLPYLPQALALRLAIPFELSPLVMMYVGRLANTVVSIVLIFMAVKTAPVFKRVIILVALMPMSIFEIASLSADGMTIAVSLLFTALVLRCTLGSRAVYRWTLVCAAALGLCKPTYAVLTMLAFIIPLARSEGGLKKWLQAALVPTAGFAAAGLWAMLIHDVYSPILWVEGVNPSAQTAYIIDEPLHYLAQIWSHYSASWHGYLELLVGRLGWVDTRLPGWFWSTFALLLLLFALIDGTPEFSLTLLQRTVSLCAAVIGIIVVTTAIYICCNPVRSAVIQGMQGRYLIPFLPAALLGFYNRKLPGMIQAYLFIPTRTEGSIGAVVGAWLVFSILFSLKILLQRYYG